MRFDRRLVGFGLFLVTVGLVMVAVRQGLIPDETARRVWNLWPLLLVGWGLSIILSGRPGAPIGGLIVAVTFGAIVGGAAATGSFLPLGFCNGDRAGGTAFPSAGGDLAASSRVSIEQDCGDLRVSTIAGSAWTLAGVSADGRQPTVNASSTALRITTRSSGPFDIGGTSAWDLALPQGPSIDLDVQANAGDARLILSGSNLSRLAIQRNAGSIRIDLREVAAIGPLTVEANAGSATIWLPNRSLAGRLNVNAGSIALCLPTGAGLRVATGESVAASNDFGSHDLIRTGNTWETPGYATAPVQIDLTAQANAASLSLDPASACAG